MNRSSREPRIIQGTDKRSKEEIWRDESREFRKDWTDPDATMPPVKPNEKPGAPYFGRKPGK